MAPTPIILDESYKTYAQCFKSDGIYDPKSIYNDPRPPGQRRVDAKSILCKALTQIRADVNARVLDVENWFDCRIENPPISVDEMLNEAMKSVGGTADGRGFLNNLLAEIDEMNANGDTSGNPMANIIQKIFDPKNWPRQGTNDRDLLENVTASVMAITTTALDMVKKAFPAFAAYGDDIVKIVNLLIDMLFYIGDFLAEVNAAQNELVVRLYALKRMTKMRDAYKTAYSVEPSKATIAKWCAYGAGPFKDPLTAPDGTTGQYDIDLAAWKAKRQVVDKVWPLMQKTFTGDAFGQFLATNVIYAAVMNAYKFDSDNRDEVLKIIADAVQKGDNSVIVQSVPKVGTCGGPSNDWEAADALTLPDPNATVCTTNYYMPFWEDVNINWNHDPNPNISRADAIAYKRSMMAALNLNYYRFTPKGFDGMWKQGDFADRFQAIASMWDTWSKIAFPYKGPTSRRNLISAQVQTIWPKLVGILNTATEANGYQYLYPFPTNLPIDMVWYNAVNFVVNGETTTPPPPDPADSKYAGIYSRCPDQSAACRPCSVIKNRRPVGGKAIEVPVLVASKTEAMGVVATMQAAGYPDYYMDCLYPAELKADYVPLAKRRAAVQQAIAASGMAKNPATAIALKNAGAAISAKISNKMYGSATMAQGAKTFTTALTTGAFKPIGFKGLSDTRDVIDLNDSLRGLGIVGNRRGKRLAGNRPADMHIEPPTMVPSGLKLHGVPDGPPMSMTTKLLFGLAAAGAAYYAYRRMR